MKTTASAATADGPTGWTPLTDSWLILPPCMIWAKIRPPLTWTASVTGFQEAASSAVRNPAVPGLEVPTTLGWMPSLRMSPALARWAK